MRSHCFNGLGIACDLTGVCGFSESDDKGLYQRLVAQIDNLLNSSGAVRDLGTAFMIGSRIPALADRLWPLLENDNQQTRLQTYRLNSSAISLAQLGAEAEKRMAAWPSERRVEAIHELADNPDNYDFLVRTANSDSDHSVRAAAIAALSWSYPASETAIQAWLAAPAEVQTQPSAVNAIEVLEENGQVGRQVRNRLREIAAAGLPEQTGIRLAQAFPDEVGPSVLEAVFTRLSVATTYAGQERLVSLAEKHAAARLLKLAEELALTSRVVPDWVGERLRNAAEEVRARVFEQAWNQLQTDSFGQLSVKVLGPLADHGQVNRSVTAWMQHCEQRRGQLDEIERERGSQLGYLLAHAPGQSLLEVVIELGESAPYEDAAALVKLIKTRIGDDTDHRPQETRWSPSVEEVRRLVQVFGGKTEPEGGRQDTVFVYLCCIASLVAPREFGDLLLEGCRRHLDARTSFQKELEESLKTGASRPSNPHLGLYLSAAMARWGFAALPELLSMMDHPAAMHFLPEVIGRIVNQPWAATESQVFRSIASDMADGAQRRECGRVMAQPDGTWQPITDEVARVLGQRLSDSLNDLESRRANGKDGNLRQAEFAFGQLLRVVARIPSAEVVGPVNRALASGFVGIFSMVDALRALVRQGLFIDEPGVVRELEAMYEREASATRLDEQSRYAMGVLSQLMYSVKPPELLTKPLSHYLSQWQRFAHHGEVIRRLGEMPGASAWTSLVEIGKNLGKKAVPEEYLPALAKALSPGYFDEFVELIADGTLFAVSGGAWSLERIAPEVAAAIGDDVGRLESLLTTCQSIDSPLADVFAGAVLAQEKVSDSVRMRYLVHALDGGRAASPDMSAYRMVRKMFASAIPTGASQYEIHPRACNELRAYLFERAAKSGAVALGCRLLLAEVECMRRESGRPLDEPRHPLVENNADWTRVLAIAD